MLEGNAAHHALDRHAETIISARKEPLKNGRSGLRHARLTDDLERDGPDRRGESTAAGVTDNLDLSSRHNSIENALIGLPDVVLPSVGDVNPNTCIAVLNHEPIALPHRDDTPDTDPPTGRHHGVRLDGGDA
jgi:hypothetical protein